MASSGEDDVVPQDTGASPTEPEGWASLDLREASRFVGTSARSAQEAAWAEARIDGRQIWGVREAQRIYGQQLRQAVLDLLVVRTLVAGMSQPRSVIGRLTPPLLAAIAEYEDLKGNLTSFVSHWGRYPAERAAAVAAPNAAGLLEVCVRKRPLLKFEVAGGALDAVETLPRDHAVLCHDGRLSRSGRRLLVGHRHYLLDHVWGPEVQTEAVYDEVVRPRVELALLGGGATVVCMGQTGTGKTHTLTGIVRSLAVDLARAGTDVSLEFFEIHGKKCFDLLSDRKLIFLRAGADGHVHVRGQHTVELAGAAGLAEAIAGALQLRAFEETERNAASSRSHAVCTLRLGAGGGVLRLVDLAGSERNYETTKMTVRQHRESALINTSLMVLKECFRAHAALQRGEPTRMPFRGSQLTQVLRECFVDAKHSTAVIATISPTADDMIHTNNTLKYATMLAKPLADEMSHAERDLPLLQKGKGALQNVNVIDWTPTDVIAWLQEVENGRFAHVVVPPDFDGRRLLETSPQGLADLFEGELRRARVDEEGEAWNIRAHRGGGALGRAIFAAARRAAMSEVGFN